MMGALACGRVPGPRYLLGQGRGMGTNLWNEGTVQSTSVLAGASSPRQIGRALKAWRWFTSQIRVDFISLESSLSHPPAC